MEGEFIPIEGSGYWYPIEPDTTSDPAWEKSVGGSLIFHRPVLEPNGCCTQSAINCGYRQK